MNPIEFIVRHTREVLAGLEINQLIPSGWLVDLGANSVDRAEIAMLVQESPDLSVSASSFSAEKHRRTGGSVFAETRCCLARSSPG